MNREEVYRVSFNVHHGAVKRGVRGIMRYCHYHRWVAESDFRENHIECLELSRRARERGR